MNPIGYVAIEYSRGGSPMEVVDGVIYESREDAREAVHVCNQIPGDERYEAAVIMHIDDLERLTAERDSLKGLLSGSQQELRDTITAQGKAERERDEARAAAKRARDIAATLHDISPYDDAECAVGCPGCQILAALGSGT